MAGNNLTKIIKKNLKVLLRSKASSLIIILGPLLIIFLAGLAFDNTNTYSVNIGVHSGSYNELSESFIAKLTENRFRIEKYIGESECADAIKEGTIHTCIIFSPDFALGDASRNEIAFYVDYSKINLVYMVMETLSEKISARSSELSLGLTTELVDTISITEQELAKIKESIVSLTTQNQETGKKADAIQSSLNGLQTNAMFTSDSISDLRNNKNRVKNEMATMKELAQQSRSKLSILIDDLEELIDDGIISEPPQLTELLNDSSNDLDEIENRLETVTNYTDLHLAELDSTVESAASHMQDAKSKLDQVSAAKTSAAEQIAGIKSMLDESLGNIMKIQESVNRIEQSISGIEIKDAGNIVNPVTTTIKPVVAKKSHLNYLFPTLVILVIMITGILLASTLVMLEKKSSAYFRNFMTPVKGITFVASTFLTNILLLLVQVVVIMGISSFFFGSQLLSSLPQTASILLLTVTIFTLLGMLVGYVFNSEESALLGSVSLGSLFLIFSDLIIPMESMPESMLSIAKYNPFAMSGDLLRKTMVNAVPFSAIWEGLLVLFAYAVLIFGLMILVQYLSKKHYLSRYVKALAPKDENEK